MAMNADQIDKAIQLCNDLQAHTLNEVVKSVKSGQRLGPKDLRLIQDIRKQLESQRTFAKGDETWLSLNQAAKRLGVNVRTLQLWCSGADELHQPALPHRLEGRRVLLPLHAAHAHLTQHAKRLALKTIEPAAIEAKALLESIDETNLPTDLVERLESTLSKMSQRLMTTPHGLRLYSQTLKILEETKARREAVMRNLTPDEAIKMLRSLGELYVEHIQHHAPALARHLDRILHEQCGINLSAHNVVALQIMEAEICVWANAGMDAAPRADHHIVVENKSQNSLKSSQRFLDVFARAWLHVVVQRGECM